MFLGGVPEAAGTATALTIFAASGNGISSLLATPDGGAVALEDVGDFIDLGSGVMRPPGVALIKTDSQGRVIANAVFHSPRGALGRSVAGDAAGNVVVLGDFEGSIDLGTGVLTGTRTFVGTMFLAKYAPGIPAVSPRAACAFPSGDIIAASPEPGMPSQMALGDDHLFYATTTPVLSRPLAGGAPAVIALGQDEIAGLALDAQSVYWATAATSSLLGVSKPDHGGAILSAPRAGGAAPVVLADHQDEPTAIAIDGQTIYWTTAGPPAPDGENAPAAGQLLSMPIGGGSPRVMASTFTRPGPVATGGGYVVLAALTNGLVDGGSQIVRVSPPGETMVLATTDRFVASLAADDTSVYWADGNTPTIDASLDDGRLRSVPLSGGIARVLQDRQAGPSNIVSMGDSLYWVNRGGASNTIPHDNGAILRMPKVGGAASTLVGGLKQVLTFAADQPSMAYVRSDNPEDGSWSLVVAPR